MNIAQPVGAAITGEGDAGAVDLLDCAREPIHIPGHVQPFGFLLALTPDWRVSHASANIGEFTGRAPEDFLGHYVVSLLDPDAVHTLRNLAATLYGKDAVQRSFNLKLVADRPAFDVAVHLSGTKVIIEAEPAVVDDREAAALVRAMVGRLKHSKDMESFFRDGARHVQVLTGFDRVMVYRFDQAGDGQVVAEALRGSHDSYLGLSYPASDIPEQARALYLRNSFRIISDVAAEPVPIRAVPEVHDRLDQSLSMLRTVSPIHIEYLKNMGVGASMSISIVVNGRLWGLFACHHHSALLPSYAYRTAAELFCEMYSLMLEGRLRRGAAENEARDRALADLLVAEIQYDERVLDDAQRVGELIFDSIPATGLCVYTGSSISLVGETPDEAQCAAIVAQISEETPRGVFATDSLETWLGPEYHDVDKAAGVLAIPLMRGPASYLLLFRIERTRTVVWAGNPDKSVTQDPNTGRLAPRHSFAAWAEQVRGKCDPFTDSELHAAETIRVALMEALVRSSDQRTTPSAEFRSGQDMLIAELNHRVRNILALIRGLISQTRQSAETSDGFITSLDERVQSLARAHDQVTTDRWGPASLEDLLYTEIGAYVDAGSQRVTVVGPNILVQPAAFTTLALVFHELVTNAAKYGALSSKGNVSIEWKVRDDGSLSIDWLEQGGPKVSAPSRRGFGSTIIERSIPYDLGGSAMVEYLFAGLHARFEIPPQHLAGVAPTKAIKQRLILATAEFQLLAGLNVLLVEDSMIIALDCAETLRSLGAGKVTTAASTAEALAAIEQQNFHFALLDFNLGDDTSSDIATILAAKGTPFAFATGYGGTVRNQSHFKAPIVTKPYGKAELIPLLIELGFK